jgi:isochorismate synthase
MPEVKQNINSLLERAINQNLSFAAWKLPETNNIHTIIGSLQLMPINKLATDAFVFSPFQMLDDKVFVIQNKGSEKQASFEEFLSPNGFISPSKTNYLELVEEGIKTVKDEQLEKVVLSRMEKLKLPDSFSPTEHFTKLCTHYPKAFVSLIYTPQSKIWLGASPELLVKTNNNEIQSVALAGTLSDQNRSDISAKDSLEQAIVARFIREKFEKLNISFRETAPEVINTGYLNHIRTKFQGTKKQISLTQLIKELHPTPAICGYPKDKAKSFILEKENNNRHLYGGFLGPVNHPDQVELYVNLRCMQIIDNHGYLYAGAGILEDSIPEDEWAETVRKMDTIRSLL